MFGKLFSYPIKCASAAINVPVSVAKDTFEVLTDAKVKYDEASNTDKAVDKFINIASGKE
jgi:hypothetical protein